MNFWNKLWHNSTYFYQFFSLINASAIYDQKILDVFQNLFLDIYYIFSITYCIIRNEKSHYKGSQRVGPSKKGLDATYMIYRHFPIFRYNSFFPWQINLISNDLSRSLSFFWGEDTVGHSNRESAVGRTKPQLQWKFDPV